MCSDLEGIVFTVPFVIFVAGGGSSVARAA